MGLEAFDGWSGVLVSRRGWFVFGGVEGAQRGALFPPQRSVKLFAHSHPPMCAPPIRRLDGDAVRTETCMERP